MFDNLINFTNSDFGKFILSLAGIATAYLTLRDFIIPWIKAVFAFFRTVNNFFVDWSGEEARPGRDATPGVMERLNNIDGQLKNNGGSTIKDAVDRIECRVNRIDDRLQEGYKEFKDLHDELDEIWNIVNRRHKDSDVHPYRRDYDTNPDDTDSTL